MSKKNQRRKNNNKVRTTSASSGIHKKLVDEMMPQIKSILLPYIYPLEQKLNNLGVKVEEIKANLITLSTVLEKTQLIKKEDFMKEFDAYEKHVRGSVKKGKMVGTSIISIYNYDLEDSDENS